MLPSAIQWLDEFPLSPTGKVNRRALPEPTTTSDVSGTSLRGPVEVLLAQLWCECLGLDGGVYRDSDFFALGGHSMLAIELSLLVERDFGRVLPLTQFFTTPTLGDMASALEAAATSRQNGLGGPCDKALVPIRRGDASQPLLLWIPGGGGSTIELQRFASALPTGIELMGFESPPHRGLPEPDSFSAMAAAYAEDVRSLERTGIIGRHRPFVLGGYSYGATLAHEVARVLFDDCRPGSVILVDPLLTTPRAQPADTRKHPRTRGIGRVVRFLRHGRRVHRVAAFLRYRWRQHRRRARRFLRSLRQRWLRRRWLRQHHGGRAPAERTDGLPSIVRQAYGMSNRLRQMHEPMPYPGSVVLVTSEEERWNLDGIAQIHSLVLGDIVSHPLPGPHGWMLSDERAEQIAAIAGAVVKDLRR
jgi:thioesterase domain-containing protein/acyl carrier protein